MQFITVSMRIIPQRQMSLPKKAIIWRGQDRFIEQLLGVRKKEDTYRYTTKDSLNNARSTLNCYENHNYADREAVDVE